MPIFSVLTSLRSYQCMLYTEWPHTAKVDALLERGADSMPRIKLVHHEACSTVDSTYVFSSGCQTVHFKQKRLQCSHTWSHVPPLVNCLLQKV